MPKRIEVDNKELIKAVTDGMHQKEIMDKFGFATVTQLKNAYANAVMEAGMVPALVGGRGGGSAPAKEVEIGKRGSVTIPKEMVDEMGFAEGDKFAVRKTKAGISLKKLD